MDCLGTCFADELVDQSNISKCSSRHDSIVTTTRSIRVELTRIEPEGEKYDTSCQDSCIYSRPTEEPGHLCTKQCLAGSQRVTGRARTPVH